MKIIKGIYQKDSGASGARNIEVLVLENGISDIKGIDLTLLSDSEKKEVKEKRMRHEEEMKPYMKAFRHFKTNKLIIKE